VIELLRSILAPYDDFDKKTLKRALGDVDFQRLEEAINCIDSIFQTLTK